MIALLSLWTWFEIAGCAFVAFFVQGALLAVTFPFDRGRLISGRFLRIMAVTAARLSPFWSFSIYGEARRFKGPTIYVANHESQADPFLISLLPWEMKWLAKASLFRLPFAGWCLRMAGDIPVERGDAASAKEAMDKCRQWLALGVPLLIFPEGTRSPDGSLGRFRDGAFRLALETGAQIVPVAVCGTHKALPKHSWKFGFTRAFVAVGSPIATAGRSPTEIRDIKAEARSQIEAMRARMLPLTIAEDASEQTA
jgi:1-acyl-sn-glycerol-3-phosphate acyltransferase